MKKTILLIDDNFLADNYPIKFNVDVKRIAATIRMTQNTLMRDLLGDELYMGIMDFVEKGEPEESPYNIIIDDARMLQVLYTAKGLYTSYFEDKDKEVRDYNIDFIEGNISFLQGIIADKIETNQELADIAGLDQGANAANTENAFDSPLYYWK